MRKPAAKPIIPFEKIFAQKLPPGGLAIRPSQQA
jgi:hypothetical protein